MVAVLTPKTGGKPIVVDKAVILVGRHPDCDYILQNSRKVSRRHVCIVQVNDKYMVRDLGSMNGVSINGDRVRTEHPIGIGDELCIGDLIFRFEEIQRLPRPPRADAVQPSAPVVAPAREEPEEVDQIELIEGANLLTPPDEDDLSQNYPVPIADEGEDESFIVLGDDDDELEEDFQVAPPQAPAAINDVVPLEQDPSVSSSGLLDDLDDVGLKPTTKQSDDSDFGSLMDSSDVIPLDESELFNLDDEAIPLVQGLTDSADEFDPIIDVGDEQIDDVIVLDDPEILDDDADDIILLD
jgi:pSer/pThr/pTyr-binding forkhead associated (FHA) protein